MTVFSKMKQTIVFKSFGELKLRLLQKSTVYVTKEQAAKQHTDIIGEDFMTFWAKTITNSYDIHLKQILSKFAN
jgi:cell division transport system permease protein